MAPRALAIALLLSGLLLVPVSAAAKGCSDNGDCSGGSTCQTWLDLWIFKLKECRATFCNTDGDCRNNTLCLLGQCQAGCRSDSDCTAPKHCVSSACMNPSGQAPAAGSIPGEGRKCAPPDGSKPPDWAVDDKGKPLGACPAGTSCSPQGFCRRLQT